MSLPAIVAMIPVEPATKRPWRLALSEIKTFPDVPITAPNRPPLHIRRYRKLTGSLRTLIRIPMLLTGICKLGYQHQAAQGKPLQDRHVDDIDAPDCTECIGEDWGVLDQRTQMDGGRNFPSFLEHCLLRSKDAFVILPPYSEVSKTRQEPTAW